MAVYREEQDNSKIIMLTPQKIQMLKKRNKGFTLVELLGVIFIISVLSTLAFGGFQIARENAKKTKAKEHLRRILGAIDLYYYDYNHLPNITGGGAAAGDATPTDGIVMDILLSKSNAQNPREKRYLDSDYTDKGFDGIQEDAATAVFYDPWRKVANPYYFLCLDHDYDDQITNPCDTAAAGVIRGKKAVAFSCGKDDLFVNTGMDEDENKDNVYSWAK